jgi:multicomponent Na+:H+ antiporter subunit C
VAELIASHYNYWVVVVLMMLGLYVVFASPNMVKRLVGLGVFQTSVILFYITMAKVTGGVPPILPEEHGEEAAHGAEEAAHGAISAAQAARQVEFPASALDQAYSNPLPHVLMLTAIVVGVATLAVGLALVVLIREAYGTIEEDEINRDEYDAQVAGGDA